MDFRIVISAVATGVRTAINEATGAFATFGARASAAVDGINARMRSVVSRFAHNQVIQAFGLDAILSYTQRTLQWADSIASLGERLGVTNRELQVLELVAQRSNISIESIATAFRHLTLAQAQAAKGKGPQVEAFQRFGLDPQAVARATPMQLWSMTGAAIDRSGRSAQVLASAVELLGRTADQVLPAMRQNMAAVADEMERSGAIVSDAVIGSLARQQQQLQMAGKSLRAVAAPILAGVFTGLDAARWVIANAARGVAAAGQAAIGNTKRASELEAMTIADTEQYGETFARNWLVDEAAAAKTRSMEAKLKAEETPPETDDEKRRKDRDEIRFHATAMDTTEQERAVRHAAGPGSAAGASMTADALQRIGLFIGGGAPQMSLLQQQVDQQRRTVNELQRVNRNLEVEE